MSLSIGGFGLPTLLLVVQLVVGLVVAADLVRSLLRLAIGISTIGQIVLAILLIALSVDGLFLGFDFIGRVTYELSVDPAYVRPGTIAVIVAAALLWATEK